MHSIHNIHESNFSLFLSISFSYFFILYIPLHTWLSSKRAVTMCWTQKPGGTSVACVEATTPPAKLWQGPSTSSAMVSSLFYHTVISTAPGEVLICSDRHRSHYTNDLNLLLMHLAGYNEVVRIPSGATNIDVRQHSYSGKPEDDNYLGKTPRKFQFPLILFLMQCVVESI